MKKCCTWFFINEQPSEKDYEVLRHEKDTFIIRKADLWDENDRELVKQYFNPPLLIELATYDGKKVPINRKTVISSRYSDRIYVFKQLESIFVVSFNERLGYCGMEMFDKDLGKIQNIFFQGGEIERLKKEGISKKRDFFDYTPLYMAKILYKYWYLTI